MFVYYIVLHIFLFIEDSDCFILYALRNIFTMNMTNIMYMIQVVGLSHSRSKQTAEEKGKHCNDKISKHK